MVSGRGDYVAEQGKEFAILEHSDRQRDDVLDGLPGGTRTPDPQLRRLVLYPVELRAVRSALKPRDYFRESPALVLLFAEQRFAGLRVIGERLS